MSKRRIIHGATHQLPSQATHAKKITATIPKRTHRVGLISRILRKKSSLNPDDFLSLTACTSVSSSESDFVTVNAESSDAAGLSLCSSLSFCFRNYYGFLSLSYGCRKDCFGKITKKYGHTCRHPAIYRTLQQLLTKNGF